MQPTPNDPVEGEYQPPASEPSPKRRPTGGIGAIVAALGFLALKFKTLLLILAKVKFLFLFAKLFAYSWTFLLSLWLYVMVYGWKFAIVLLVVLVAHELGHYFAFRAYGLPARLPVFVPFLGAYTSGAPAQDLEQDAYIALAGPLTGLALAGVCYGMGVAFGDPFWYAAASVSAFLNLFNMIPMPPFDGGRVIGAVSPVFWIVGTLLFVLAAVVMHVPLLFVIIVAVLGAPAMYAALRGNPDPRAAQMTAGARARVSIWYLITLIGLVIVMGHAHSFTGAM